MKSEHLKNDTKTLGWTRSKIRVVMRSANQVSIIFISPISQKHSGNSVPHPDVFWSYHFLEVKVLNVYHSLMD